MQLTLWTYEGPPHIGAMRVATAMKGLHYVLHAPQGDTYADLLFTMIERRNARPPVTYTTFQARDLGGDTAELFKTAAREAYERFQPQAMIVGASCTAELIQDDPGGLAAALNLPRARGGAGTAGLPAQGKLGRFRDLLPTGARAVHAARSAARHAPRTRPRPACPLQCAGPHRAGLPPQGRPARSAGPVEAPGRRHQCCRAPGCHAARPDPPGQRRLQCRDVPRSGHAGCAVAVAQLRPDGGEDRAAGRGCHARIHQRSGCAERR